ncbi:hypothetical protein [Algoriphagus aquimarinus]|uniref:hypothetical protein n=1 Tax=Algoriphagus aquimarinus TaxID=237018 RepID=UPI0030D76B5B|tara:strand:- start:55093 stop:56127 length:1035 start_codon:yes stop_codon:yes gene_type:complete
MKQSIVLIIISLCFSGYPLFAQTHFFSLKDEQIDLSSKSFNVTQVLDKRSDKSSIGWTQKGLGNIRVDANFSDPLEQELISFLNSNLNSDGIDIQLIIRSLFISEKTGLAKETGFCELSIDFLMVKDFQLYRILQTELISEITGADITKKHTSNIANAFKMSFDRLEALDLSKTDNFLAIAPEALAGNIPDSSRYNFPIFTEEIKTGIYDDYDALKNNSPSNMEDFYFEQKERKNDPWKGTFEIIPKFHGSHKKVKNVWAFAIGGQIYVYHQREFFPLTIENYKLYYYGYGIPSGHSASTGAVIGGLIGTGIAAGIESTNSKNQKVKYHLDPDTGEIRQIHIGQ